MIRKICSICLVLFFVLFLFACDSDNGDSTDIAKIWSAPNTEKIMRDALAQENEGVLHFETFKGDVEAAQIIFTALEKINSFNFKMQDLVHENGTDTISKEEFEVFVQKYIEVTVPTTNGLLPGWYPDALIPLENYKMRKEDKVNVGHNQGLWINFNVSKDAKAGFYSGEAILTLNGEEIKIPVKVKIFDFEMSEEFHSKMAFYIDESNIGIGEGKAATYEMRETYYWFMANKKVTPLKLPNYSIATYVNPEEYALDLVKYAENPMVSAYALQYTVAPDGAVDKQYVIDLLTAILNLNIELRKDGSDINLFKKAHYYLGNVIDEPVPTMYDLVRTCDLRIHEAKLEVASQEILDDHPDLRESILKLPHVVTTKITDQLFGTDTVGGVQTWCPTIDFYNSKSSRELALDRKNSTDRTGGEDIWWYTCIFPKYPYPTLHTDDYLISSRLIKWMQFNYKVSGQIFWCVNHWRGFQNNQFVSRDFWNDPLSWESCNGDGQLIYPGSKYGVPTPISTIRLESLREGIEDYEMLWLFEQKINELNQAKGTDFDSDTILENYFSKMYVGVITDCTPEEFKQYRSEIMYLLELLHTDQDQAVLALEKLN